MTHPVTTVSTNFRDCQLWKLIDAIGRVRLPVRLFQLYLLNRLTFELCACES